MIVTHPDTLDTARDMPDWKPAVYLYYDGRQRIWQSQYHTGPVVFSRTRRGAIDWAIRRYLLDVAHVPACATDVSETRCFYTLERHLLQPLIPVARSSSVPDGQ